MNPPSPWAVRRESIGGGDEWAGLHLARCDGSLLMVFVHVPLNVVEDAHHFAVEGTGVLDRKQGQLPF